MYMGEYILLGIIVVLSGIGLMKYLVERFDALFCKLPEWNGLHGQKYLDWKKENYE